MKTLPADAVESPFGLSDLGQEEEAEFFLRKAIQIDNSLAEAYYNLGNLLRKKLINTFCILY